MRYAFFAVFLLGLGFLVISCEENYKFKKQIGISEDIWTYSDSLIFKFSIADTNKIYDLYLDISHHPSYAYQNLYTRINTVFPRGRRLRTELSLELANKGGVWHGDCSSESCLLSIPIQQKAYFNQIGDHKIVLEQYMRKDSIPGIQEFTLKLKEVGER